MNVKFKTGTFARQNEQTDKSILPVAGLLLCVSVAFLFFAGCRNSSNPSGSDSSGTGGAKSTLIYGRGSDSDRLDPINTDIGEAVKVIVNIFDTLVRYGDDSLDVVPGLATEWSHSDDGLEWTFQLRPKVKFHDGTDCNADAVVFSFERLLLDEHPGLFDKIRPYQPSFNMIEKVSALDAQTVVFRLKQPSAIFLNNLAMFPGSVVSPTAVKRLGKEFSTNPVGTGPFRFSKWKRDQQIVLDANADYWGGAPTCSRVIFVPISDSVTRSQQLRQGAIHVAEDLPPTEMDALESTPGIKVQNQEGLNVGYLTLQTEKPPLNVLKVRQAIGHAIDKAALARVVYGGHARPAVNMVPPTMWGHHDSLQDRPFDPSLAKKLMEEGIVEAGLTLPFRLKLAVMSQPRPYMQQPLETASFIKDALSKIGIEITVEPRPTNQHFPYCMSGQHEIALAGWTTDNNDPDNFLYPMLDLNNITQNGNDGNNLSRYRSEPFHELLMSAQRELDKDQRHDLYQKAQELVLADAPVIPLVHTRIRVAHRSNVKGYSLHPSSLPFLRTARIEELP